MTTDIDANVKRYLDRRNPEARYSSFDYCFNYFQSFYETDSVNDLNSPGHLEESCLQLAFYLASWGMLRGSSDLLQRSAKYYRRVINAVTQAPARIWQLDVAGYDDAGIDLLVSTQRQIGTAFLESASPTLVTKVMLGVFGCVPAFDTYFKRGLGVWTFGPSSLTKVRSFYDQHAVSIESHRSHTLDFATGLPTERRYTQAKVVDMILFTAGMGPGDDSVEVVSV